MTNVKDKTKIQTVSKCDVANNNVFTFQLLRTADTSILYFNFFLKYIDNPKPNLYQFSNGHLQFDERGNSS